MKKTLFILAAVFVFLNGIFNFVNNILNPYSGILGDNGSSANPAVIVIFAVEAISMILFAVGLLTQNKVLMIVHFAIGIISSVLSVVSSVTFIFRSASDPDFRQMNIASLFSGAASIFLNIGMIFFVLAVFQWKNSDENKTLPNSVPVQPGTLYPAVPSGYANPMVTAGYPAGQAVNPVGVPASPVNQAVYPVQAEPLGGAGYPSGIPSNPVNNPGYAVGVTENTTGYGDPFPGPYAQS